MTGGYEKPIDRGEAETSQRHHHSDVENEETAATPSGIVRRSIAPETGEENAWEQAGAQRNEIEHRRNDENERAGNRPGREQQDQIDDVPHHTEDENR